MAKKRPAYLPPYQLFALLIVALASLYLFSPLGNHSQDQPVINREATLNPRDFQADNIALPSPSKTGRVSVEQALNSRRSRRVFIDRDLTLNQISQMLWSAQGVTTNWGGRTTPSAKSAYPLTAYLLVKNENPEIDQGVYQYIPGDLEPIHELGVIRLGDYTEDILDAANQTSSETAPIIIVITGNFATMADAFDGDRHDENVYLEVGHAAQNMYLEAQALGLGMVVTGGFDHSKTAKLLDLPENETPIYWIPVGYPEN